MLSCKEASHLMSEALDRKLSWRESLGLKLHVSMCDGCANFQKQMSVIRHACKQMMEPHDNHD